MLLKMQETLFSFKITNTIILKCEMLRNVSFKITPVIDKGVYKNSVDGSLLNNKIAINDFIYHF